MATTDQRTHLVSAAEAMIAEAKQIGYFAGRPMLNIHTYEQSMFKLLGSGHSVSMDCSEFVTLMCRWAGLSDPNGMGFDGYGNSETMYNFLPHYTNAEAAHPGAIVAFGVADGLPLDEQHCALVLTPGADPMLASHGSDAGPIEILFSELLASSTWTATWLDVGGL